MSKEKRYVPNLKFEEFKNDGEWAPKKFANIVTRISATSDNKSLPRIEYEDIISSRGTLNKDIYRKNSIKKGIEFQSQDILFGKLRPYLKNWLFPDFTGVAVGDFWVFRSSDTNPKFIYSLIQTERYQRISNLSTGTKMPRSDWNIVSNTNFIIPKSMKEQQKIGRFFENIGKMIQLQQSKVNKVKDIKSAYLSEMFPKEGEKYPKKRFEGFTEPWIEYSLERIGDIVGGNSWKSNEYDKEGSHLIITIANVSGDYSVDINEGNKITPNNNRYVLSEGDILISMTGNVGRVSRMPEVKAVLNQRVGKLVIDSGIDKEFIFTILQNKKFERNMILQGQGAAQLNISRTDILDYRFKIPEYTEQKKIGQLFSNINEQISIEEKKLAKLENLKQGYLNDMFV